MLRFVEQPCRTSKTAQQQPCVIHQYSLHRGTVSFSLLRQVWIWRKVSIAHARAFAVMYHAARKLRRADYDMNNCGTTLPPTHTHLRIRIGGQVAYIYINAYVRR